MAELTNDTGSAWLATGVASTTYVDIYAVSNWSFIAAPTGFDAAIEQTDTASASYLTFESDADIATAELTGVYWQSFWLRINDTGVNVADDDDGINLINDYNEAPLRSITYDRVLVREDGDVPELQNSIGFYHGGIEGGGTDYSLYDTAKNRHGSLGFGDWVQFDLLYESANPGRKAIFLNGVLVTEWHGADTTQARPATASDVRPTFQFTGTARALNCIAQVAPPLLSYSTERPSGALLLPDWTQGDGADTIQKLLFHHLRPLAAADHGRHWSYAVTGDTTVTTTTYHENIFEPRVVVTHNTGGTMVATSSQDIGTLPFRDKDGWCSVVLRDFIHVATNATMSWSLRNATDDDDLCLLSVAADGNVTLNGTVLSGDDWMDPVDGHRHTLTIHLHSGGACHATIFDNTSDGTSRYAGSAIGGDWTPGSVGPVVITSTGTGAATIDLGAVAVCKAWDTAGVDSMSSNVQAELTPDIHRHNHLTRAMYALPCWSIPGGWYPYKEVYEAASKERRQITSIIGRTGLTQAACYTNAIQYLTYTRGMRFWLLDGGSINDSSSFTQVTNAATAASEAAALNTVTDSILSVLIPNNEAHICTMAQRTLLAHWIANEAACESFVAQRNAGLLSLSKKHQSGGRITFSDTSTIPITDSDDTDPHPTSQNSYDINAAMIATEALVGVGTTYLTPGMGMGMGIG